MHREWWNAWQEAPSEQFDQPIDNEGLTLGEAELVPEAVWRTLLAWYGGGPEVSDS